MITSENAIVAELYADIDASLRANQPIIWIAPSPMNFQTIVTNVTNNLVSVSVVCNVTGSIVLTVSVFKNNNNALGLFVGNLTGMASASRRRSPWTVMNVTASGTVPLSATITYCLVFSVSSSSGGFASIASSSGNYPAGALFISGFETASDVVLRGFMGLSLDISS